MLEASPITSETSQRPATWNVRLFVVCLAALSVSLPIAWISLAKVLLFSFGLVYLIGSLLSQRRDSALGQLWTTRLILGILILFALSLFWTEADTQSALYSYVKHAKLMGILLMVCFIRTPREARMGLLFYAGGQGFLLLSSWLMFVGIPIPWAAGGSTNYVVFSTYLDQSIMLAAAAAVFWHLRDQGLWAKWIGFVASLLALADALLLLEGRTGYLVALSSLSLAVMWAMPKRFRLATMVVTPLVVLIGLSFLSTQVHERVTKIFSESVNYSKSQRVATADSSGWRLNAWRRSVQAIEAKPIYGHGVGAWTPAIKQFEGEKNATLLFGAGNHSNPHQEYLLWGVELGVGGTLLLIALMVCILRDALQFPTGVQRATLSVLAAMAIACLFNSTLYDDWIGDFFCISLGLLLAAGVRSTSSAQVLSQHPAGYSYGH
jgi:O-antigen ligase